jgi:Holliday junction resolvase RusA-like endonuclease
MNAPPPAWERAEVQATFYRPGKRAKLLDRDNAIAMCKGAFDGLQEAGVIVNDSGLVPLPPIQVIGDAADERKLVLVIREL